MLPNLLPSYNIICITTGRHGHFNFNANGASADDEQASAILSRACSGYHTDRELWDSLIRYSHSRRSPRKRIKDGDQESESIGCRWIIVARCTTMAVNQHTLTSYWHAEGTLCWRDLKILAMILKMIGLLMAGIETTKIPTIYSRLVALFQLSAPSISINKITVITAQTATATQHRSQSRGILFLCRIILQKPIFIVITSHTIRSNKYTNRFLILLHPGKILLTRTP